MILAAGTPPQAAGFDRDAEFAKGVEAFQRRDYDGAWFHFWGLARAGDPDSQYNLGQMYRRGEGVPRDLVQARRWYEAAANQGFELAQFQLGVIWETGNGVAPDLGAARRWYALAARAGHEGAREALRRVESALASGRVRTVIETPEAPPAAAARPNPPAGPRRPPPDAN
ncbi:MAG: sel1 repeat family protein [Azospirillum sp.]|nr:sel1 repeat family protein [Azospirillum sp.]MCA3265795.1 sel1 repeat family protein [Azospirillum sp.]MCZ8122822.1 tetratricopeptide repeat protein [Magnetospirillum sp.]